MPRIDKSDELVLAKRMLDCDMAALIEESAIPRDAQGCLELGGAFWGPHTRGRQRLIFDRRPQNAQEHSLNWCDLPHGVLFTRMFLEPDETARGSGDDVEVFYFQLAQQHEFLVRNGFGRRISGVDAKALGADPSRHYRLALRTIGMGDKKDVCVAQATHEDLLRRFKCLTEPTRMSYKKGAPTGSVWEGIYIDDHVVCIVLPTESLPCIDDSSLCSHCHKLGACQHQDVEAQSVIYTQPPPPPRLNQPGKNSSHCNTTSPHAFSCFHVYSVHVRRPPFRTTQRPHVHLTYDQPSSTHILSVCRHNQNRGCKDPTHTCVSMSPTLHKP